MAALSVAIQHRSMARDRSPKPRSLPSYVLIDDQSSNHKLLIVRRRIVRITNEVVEKKLISTIHLYLAGEPSNTLRAWWKKPAGEEPRASPSPGSRTIDVEATVELGRRAWSDVGGSGGEGVAWPWRCYDGGENRPPTPARAARTVRREDGGGVCGCGQRPVQRPTGRKWSAAAGEGGDGGGVSTMDGCATVWRARGGQGRASRASAPCPRRRKPGPNLGREWVAGGQKADTRPFASARWAGVFVRFHQNEHARTKCVGALELPLDPTKVIHFDEL